MFDHVTIRVTDRAASETFYATLLRILNVKQTRSDEQFAEWDDFSLAERDHEHPVTRRLHVAFAAPSRAEVDEFWRVGTGAGYRDDGAPGVRPQYSEDYYGAFLLDPDGNSAEAVHRKWPASPDTYSQVTAPEGAVGSPLWMGPPGNIDHLWIRVADVAAAKQFYLAIAPHAGLRLGNDTPERAQFRGKGGSFSLVRGAPTAHVHLAFPAADNATVDSFHRAATESGYRDNGPPAERPVYHPGYYGAFVLDPDGNNIEVVNHNRAR